MIIRPMQPNQIPYQPDTQRTKQPAPERIFGLGSFLLRTSLTCLLLCHGPVATADEKKPLNIGDTAPGWTDLLGTDDLRHSLSDLRDKDVIVVCFTSNTCPYSVDYEQRLIAFQKKHADTSVQLIAINSNTIPGDRMDAMKDRASEKQFNFPYLSDETQQVARAFGAVYTPEFFVFNKERRLIYKGAMDDDSDASKVKVQYVDLAVQAAIQGQLPEVTQKGARGCAIRFKRSRT